MARTYVGRLRDGQARVLVFETEGVRPLVNRGAGPGAAFRWGGPGHASPDLARSLLWDVLGTEPGVLLSAAFAADVLDRLPLSEFELAERGIQRWLFIHGAKGFAAAELRRHLDRIDRAEPADEAALLDGFLDRCWSERALRQ